MTNPQFESVKPIRYEVAMLTTNEFLTQENKISVKSMLEQLIEPLTLDQFEHRFLFKEPYSAPFKAKPFEGLLSWMLLWEIFSTGHNDCWLPRHGELPKDPSESTGRLTMEQARRGFQEGRTILVRHAEKAHPILAAIARDFFNVFHDPIDIQLYCTPEGEEGFDWHYDVEEVFVIQSVGEKEFRLRKNTINPYPLNSKLPKNMRFEQEPPGPEIRCHLKAGDWLYIPSGWWHKARAITPSFHMSVGVMALTGVTYLESIVQMLAENPEWRKRLPLRGWVNKDSKEEKMQVFRGAIHQLNDQLHHLLSNEEALITFFEQIIQSKN